MEEVLDLCKDITEEYSERDLNEIEQKVIKGLAKFRKVIKKLGSANDPLILESLEKFRKVNGSLDESWYSRPLVFKLYVEGKVIRGPEINFSKIYAMASRLDRKNKTSLKHKLLHSVLSLSEKEPNFNLLQQLVNDNTLLTKDEFRRALSWSNKELCKRKPEDVFMDKQLQDMLKDV